MQTCLWNKLSQVSKSVVSLEFDRKHHNFFKVKTEEQDLNTLLFISEKMLSFNE